MTARRAPHPEDWRPNAGPQTRFLGLTCYEALYGGAAGGGKSDAILVDAIRYVGRGYGAGYQALLLRRTFPELEKGLILRSQELYRRIGGVYSVQSKAWTFPGGERVVFGYLDSLSDVYRYQGLAFQFIGFDELTQFAQEQYVYLLSRLRHGGTARFPLRVRSTTNPGGGGHEWVFKRFGAWLDPKARERAGTGQILSAVRGKDDEERFVRADARPYAHDGRFWMVDNEGATFEVAQHMMPLGRTFVLAKLEDNPAISDDPTYKRSLDELDPVRRAQLRDGNWLVKPAAGKYFKRPWFSDRFLDEAPAGTDVTHRVRAWDLGATVDGDWSVGVKSSRLRASGDVVVEHARRFRERPAGVDREILATAQADGKSVSIHLPQDPGQAGVAQCAHFAKLLWGYNVIFTRPTGEKQTRAGGFSSQCEARNVWIVRGAWNDPFLDVLEAFPDGQTDDDVDAASDAFNALAAAPPIFLPDTLPTLADRGF